MRGHVRLALLVGAVSVAVLVPRSADAATGADSPRVNCDPFVLQMPTSAATNARVTEAGFEAGVVEPNVEAAYQEALAAGGRASQARRAATGPVHVPVTST